MYKAKIFCPSKPKTPYKEVINHFEKLSGVQVFWINEEKIRNIKGYKILLDPKGEKFNLEKIKEILENKEVNFIVGGPKGINIEADLKISFGDYILNHQLAIIILLEQLYRLKNLNSKYNQK